MAYFDPGELKGKTSRLVTLLEKDREEITNAVKGDIAQPYQELLEMELSEARKIKSWLEHLFW